MRGLSLAGLGGVFEGARGLCEGKLHKHTLHTHTHTHQRITPLSDQRSTLHSIMLSTRGLSSCVSVQDAKLRSQFFWDKTDVTYLIMRFKTQALQLQAFLRSSPFFNIFFRSGGRGVHP